MWFLIYVHMGAGVYGAIDNYKNDVIATYETKEECWNKASKMSQKYSRTMILRTYYCDTKPPAPPDHRTKKQKAAARAEEESNAAKVDSVP